MEVGSRYRCRSDKPVLGTWWWLVLVDRWWEIEVQDSEETETGAVEGGCGRQLMRNGSRFGRLVGLG